MLSVAFGLVVHVVALVMVAGFLAPALLYQRALGRWLVRRDAERELAVLVLGYGNRLVRYDIARDRWLAVPLFPPRSELWFGAWRIERERCVWECVMRECTVTRSSSRELDEWYQHRMGRRA